MALSTFLSAYAELDPSEITSALRTIVRPISADAHALSAFTGELDAALNDSRVSAYHYALALRVSQSLTWAVQCFDTRRELEVLDGAIDVLAFNLKNPKKTSAALGHFGGADGLVAFVGQKLSFACTKRLFKELAATRPSADLLPVVDALLGAAFAFDSSDSAKPLKRLALLMTQTILASASAQTLRTVLPYVAELVSEHQWGRLVERHPTLMEELLLAQVGVRPRDAARWANAGVLERPSCLAPCVDLLLRCGKPLGPAFFRKFLHAYAKHTVDNPTTQTGLDVLGVTAERVMSLDMYMRYYLLSYPDRKVRVREALSVLSVYKTIQSVEGGSGWTWKYIRRLLPVLVEEFSRRPDLWDAALQQPISATDDILSALIGLFKELGPGVIQMQTLSNTVQLATQPRGARFPLIALAYSALGLTLTVVPSGAAVSQYPPCPMGVLASLDPDHCRMFLQTGLEVMGNSFFHYSASKMSHQSALIVSDTLELLDELPAEQQNEARMAILRAACVGARRGPAGDMASGTEGLTDVRNDIDGYVKLAARSPDASLRLLHIQMALNLCMLAQSPQRFHETLQPVLQKYAKDPVVGPGIFNYVASTPHVLRFLAGPPGLYVKRSVAARVTREVLVVDVQSGRQRA
ncbi:hypothetical protein EXIGLDRAFT_771015 [Exidia glandulosa HHB12029]|uniref:Uncharacterized protein n=1 Tax=Exidia glandulosa HHB12029 TaxID=1314781 RepID=A0A166AB04_EXIGL|nr:hypothetical protein EXIGLDRAFT_771015 [Exidia glandulosa HHB12029]